MNKVLENKLMFQSCRIWSGFDGRGRKMRKVQTQCKAQVGAGMRRESWVWWSKN